MSRPLRISVVLLLMLLTACSTQSLVPVEAPELKLLPPAEISNELLLKQKITFEAGGRQQQFLVVARFQRQRLKLVLLLPAGQPLLTLDFDGENFIQENRSSIELPGKEILASMQFSLWPEQSLRRHYSPESGWQVKIKGQKRSLSTASGAFLNISRKSETLIVDNHFHNYRVIIQTLEQTQL